MIIPYWYYWYQLYWLPIDCLLIAYALWLIAYWLPIDIPPRPHVRGPPLGPSGGTVGPPVGAGVPQRAQHMGGGGMSIGNQWAINHRACTINRQSIGNQYNWYITPYLIYPIEYMIENIYLLPIAYSLLVSVCIRMHPYAFICIHHASVCTHMPPLRIRTPIFNTYFRRKSQKRHKHI